MIRPFLSLRSIVALVALAATTTLAADLKVKVSLVDGTILRGRLVAMDAHQATFRIDGKAKKVDLDRIELIDFGGGPGGVELDRLAETARPHLVVKRTGTTIAGRIKTATDAMIRLQTPGGPKDVRLEDVVKIILKKTPVAQLDLRAEAQKLLAKAVAFRDAVRRLGARVPIVEPAEIYARDCAHLSALAHRKDNLIGLRQGFKQADASFESLALRAQNSPILARMPALAAQWRELRRAHEAMRARLG